MKPRNFRLTVAQSDHLRKRAAELGISAGAFVRRLVEADRRHGAKAPAAPPLRRLDGSELRRLDGSELRRIDGSELRRIDGSELRRIDELPAAGKQRTL